MNKVDHVWTVGIHLECEPDDIEYHLNNNQKYPRQTAFQILLWFENHYTSEVEKWTKLIKALSAMEKNTTVTELGLHKLRQDAIKAESGGLESSF